MSPVSLFFLMAICTLAHEVGSDIDEHDRLAASQPVIENR